MQQLSLSKLKKKSYFVKNKNIVCTVNSIIANFQLESQIIDEHEFFV